MPRRHPLSRRPKLVLTDSAKESIRVRSEEIRAEAEREKARKAAQEEEAARNIEAQEKEKALRIQKEEEEAAKRKEEEEKAKKEEEVRKRQEEVQKYLQLYRERRAARVQALVETEQQRKAEVESRLPRVLAHPNLRLFSKKAQTYVLTQDLVSVLEGLGSDAYRLSIEAVVRS